MEESSHPRHAFANVYWQANITTVFFVSQLRKFLEQEFVDGLGKKDDLPGAFAGLDIRTFEGLEWDIYELKDKP
jgi:hypothetical protein